MQSVPDTNTAIELLSYCPKRPDYDDWVRIISAVGNSYDEQTAIRILSTHFQNEKPGEIANKVKRRLRNVTIGTLFYYAKKNGYKPTKNNANGTGKNYTKHEKKATLPKPARIKIENKSGLIYNTQGERIFKFSINFNILNKNLKRNGEPYTDFNILTNKFVNTEGTLNEIIACISKGYAVCFSELNGNDFYKKKVITNFKRAELIGIDIDNSYIDEHKQKQRVTGDNYISIESVLKDPMTKRASLLYTTTNHRPDWHRFRLIFALPTAIEDPDIYKKLITKLVTHYKADPAPTSIVNAFYGNNLAKIYNLETGEIYDFTNRNS